MDDERIIELFWARSEAAIEALEEKYGALCRRVAQQILGDSRDSEECVSDAYLGVWNTVPPRRPDPLAAYVCRIVRNQALKRYHANRAQKRGSQYDAALEELEDGLASDTSVEDEVEARELSRALDRFLASLDRESRVLFVRRYWYSDSIESLAALFRVREHTISARLWRLRQKLRRELERKGEFL